MRQISLILLFSFGLDCSSMARMEELHDAGFIAPPIVRKLVFRADRANGEIRYYLLVYDNGDFLVKEAATRADLESTARTPSMTMNGRIGSFVWALEANGLFYATDVLDPQVPGLEDSEERFEHQNHTYTLILADVNTSFARAVMTYGIPLYLEGSLEMSNGRFIYRATDGRKMGGSIKKFFNGNQTEFEATYSFSNMDGVIPPPRIGVYGELGDYGLPRRYEMWRLDSDGNPSEKGVTVTIQEISLSSEPLPVYLLRPESWLSTGYSIMANFSHEEIAVEDWRRVSVFGILIKPRTLIIILLGAGIAAPILMWFVFWRRVPNNNKTIR